MIDLTTEIAGLKFRNPILTAAGPTTRNADEIQAALNGGVGGIVTKTISTEAAIVPRPNMAVIGRKRSLGLLNTELWSEKKPDEWFNEEYPKIRNAVDLAKTSVIGSVGYTPEQVSQLVPKMIESGCQGIEFSTHYIEEIEEVPKAIREAIGDESIPIFGKMSPHRQNDLEKIVKALNPYVDGFTAINSFGPTLQIDINTGKPLLGSASGYGWMSGSVIKPIAIRVVSEIARLTKKPIIGVGGVSKGTDVIEFLMVGASAVEVCTASILHGQTIYGKIAQEMAKWMENQNYKNIDEIKGKALPYLPEKELRTHTIPPDIDYRFCNECSICLKSCVYHALSITDKLHVDKEKCEGCGVCVSVCMRHALSFS
ncbi:MAG: 4Fe-4S binding protein [Candidatus Hodarchaeales archaeon]|jgi:dihydroorotate dehydrogenase subfamily 1